MPIRIAYIFISAVSYRADGRDRYVSTSKGAHDLQPSSYIWSIIRDGINQDVQRTWNVKQSDTRVRDPDRMHQKVAYGDGVGT